MENSEEDSPVKTPVSGEEPPPFLRTWNRLYGAIAVYTCILVLVLYIMTVTLNR